MGNPSLRPQFTNSVWNLYPMPYLFSAEEQTMISGNTKLNNSLRFKKGLEVQLTAVYLAPDILGYSYKFNQ